MKPLPATAAKFRSSWPKFSAWLTEHGSEIRVPSNPYELARFTTPEGVGVVYRNDAGMVTSWTGGAERAWQAWKDSALWAVGEKAKRQGRKRKHRIDAIMQRDGRACFFCGEPLGSDITLEHLVPVTHGGPDHLSNLVLAHEACNLRAGHLAAAEKVRLRDLLRGAAHPTPNTEAGAIAR